VSTADWHAVNMRAPPPVNLLMHVSNAKQLASRRMPAIAIDMRRIVERASFGNPLEMQRAIDAQSDHCD